MRFVNHSMYDNWTVSVEGPNVSTIIDKLIRLAAKNTEYYASDIVYEICRLKDAVREEREMDVYIGFRDGGVSSYESAGHVSLADDAPLSCVRDIIQWWRLRHIPNRGHDAQTILIRVDLVC